jgi:tetratricopeptide (TPR) repeat protein
MGENAREVLPDAIRKGGSIIDEGYPEEFLDVLKRLEKMEGLSPKILSYLFFHEGHAYYVLGDYEKAIKANKQALEYADSELKPRISRWLGDTYQLINNPDAALSAYDESLKYASPTVAVELVSRKANVYSAIGDMKRALKTIKRAQSKVKKCKNPSTVAEVHNLSGLIYLSLWRAEEARKSLQLAYNISEKYRNMRNLCNSHMYMSQVYYQLRGYEGANRSSEAAYRIGSKIGYIPALAGIYVIQAPLLKDAGDITGSSDNLFRGVRLAKSRNARQWLAEAYMFLGDIFRTFGEMKNATGYANLAIDWSEKIKDKQTWGEAILRKGVFQIEMANIKEGRKNLKRGIRILKKNKCKRNKAWIKIQLSEANYAQKKLKSSIKNLQGAIKILEKLSNRKELYLAYISIAVKSMEMNNMEEAKEYLDKARKVAGENSWYEEAVYSIAYIHFQILQGEKMGDRIESLSVDLREKGYIVDMANLFYHASLAYKVIDNPDWRTFSRKAADVYESIGLSQYLNLVPNPKREAEKKE